ncbi:MAG: protein kinase, partial [Phycisphaerales bacterium]|nr:protein kinase [Phycisphaerales bacterium]
MSPDPATPPTPPHLKIGDVFAERYEIVGVLAPDGPVDVYKAEDQQSRQAVVLKRIKAGSGVDKKILDAYQRDLAAARKISHPRFVRILDSGGHQGDFYVVLEYIDGQSIELLASDQKRLPMSDFLSLFRQMCETLAPLHEQDFVHGDVSFSTFLLAMDGTLKLMDFGLGRYLPNLKSGAGPYMSPEQIKSSELRPASDVYALGALALDLLSGRKPAAGTSRPLQVPKDMHGAIPPALAAAMEKCLEADP